jgi:hypothetical protein
MFGKEQVKKLQAQGKKIPLASLTSEVLVWASLADLYTEKFLAPPELTFQPFTSVEEDIQPPDIPQPPPPVFYWNDKNPKLQCLEDA